MANINITTLSVPRTPRNKRIYSGTTYVTKTVSSGTSGSSSSTHIEAKVLKYDNGDFDSRDVTVEFTYPISVPVGFVKVYRYEAREGGGYYVADAVHYVDDSDWITEDGFSLHIESYEALEGIIIEYSFTEQS